MPTGAWRDAVLLGSLIIFISQHPTVQFQVASYNPLSTDAANRHTRAFNVQIIKYDKLNANYLPPDYPVAKLGERVAC